MLVFALLVAALLTDCHAAVGDGDQEDHRKRKRDSGDDNGDDNGEGKRNREGTEAPSAVAPPSSDEDRNILNSSDNSSSFPGSTSSDIGNSRCVSSECEPGCTFACCVIDCEVPLAPWAQLPSSSTALPSSGAAVAASSSAALPSGGAVAASSSAALPSEIGVTASSTALPSETGTTASSALASSSGTAAAASAALPPSGATSAFIPITPPTACLAPIWHMFSADQHVVLNGVWRGMLADADLRARERRALALNETARPPTPHVDPPSDDL
jgi:hypothetical protein